MKMKIFCIVMLTLFLMFALASTIGCIIEWSGKCDVCEHADGCNIVTRARLFSAFCTAVLWICSGAWAVLTIEYVKEDQFKKKFKETKEIEGYINMKG